MHLLNVLARFASEIWAGALCNLAAFVLRQHYIFFGWGACLLWQRQLLEHELEAQSLQFAESLECRKHPPQVKSQEQTDNNPGSRRRIESSSLCRRVRQCVLEFLAEPVQSVRHSQLLYSQAGTQLPKRFVLLLGSEQAGSPHGGFSSR